MLSSKAFGVGQDHGELIAADSEGIVFAAAELVQNAGYFEQDGKRYHHIIQPATGEPANGVHSATIVGPDAVITDALSTSVFIMGVDQGLRLIATLPDYEGIVIDAEGRLYYSDGLRPPGDAEATEPAE